MASKPLMFAGAVKRIIQGNQRMGFSKQRVKQETGPATRLQALLTVGGHRREEISAQMGAETIFMARAVFLVDVPTDVCS